MAQKLAWLSLMIGLTMPVWAAGSPGSISGVVKNSAGVAQLGATVEILGASPIPVATVFTNPSGGFKVPRLAPGKYYIRVSAPSFLPSLREDIVLKSGASLVLHITLNTLSEALQMLPARRRTAADQDDWKWTVRSSGNRPILRVLEDGPLVVVAHGDSEDDKVLKARVAFLAGSEGSGFGNTADMTTAFSVERSMFRTGTLSVKGKVGYDGATTPDGTVRATYAHKLPNGSEPQVSFTLRRFATPDTVLGNAALQALALSLSDSFSLLNFIDVNVGSEYETIQYRGHVSAIRPFASAGVHLSPNTVVEYRYATSVPNTRSMKGFNAAPADLSESGPRISLRNAMPLLERARHHEVSLSRRFGPNSAQLALFNDHFANPAITGIGEASGEFLRDVYSGTFTFAGRDFDASGVRLVLQRKLASDLTATVDYSYGGVLQLDGRDLSLQEARSGLSSPRRHAVAYKMSGAIPRSHTQWLASYKWTSGAGTLTSVDMFNVSPGQSDPFLNVFIRQPIPGTGFMPGRIEALIDVRNLMAQGYVPVLGNDGHTLYLVQSARSIRGGLAFVF